LPTVTVEHEGEASAPSSRPPPPSRPPRPSARQGGAGRRPTSAPPRPREPMSRCRGCSPVGGPPRNFEACRSWRASLHGCGCSAVSRRRPAHLWNGRLELDLLRRRRRHEGEVLLVEPWVEIPGQDHPVLGLRALGCRGDDQLARQRPTVRLDADLPVDVRMTERVVLAGHSLDGAGSHLGGSADPSAARELRTSGEPRAGSPRGVTESSGSGP
jgi:hypothetical protein